MTVILGCLLVIGLAFGLDHYQVTEQENTQLKSEVATQSAEIAQLKAVNSESVNSVSTIDGVAIQDLGNNP